MGPGDARGWVERQHGFQLPNPILDLECAALMTEDACRLTSRQRERVHKQVAETCEHKQWLLHAVNCRSNHVHVVLSSPAPPKTIREQLKANLGGQPAAPMDEIAVKFGKMLAHFVTWLCNAIPGRGCEGGDWATLKEAADWHFPFPSCSKPAAPQRRRFITSCSMAAAMAWSFRAAAEHPGLSGNAASPPDARPRRPSAAGRDCSGRPSGPAWTGALRCGNGSSPRRYVATGPRPFPGCNCSRCDR